jgi:hypothetical protein
VIRKLSKTTFRLGPNVTETASTIISIPRSKARRALSWYKIFFAIFINKLFFSILNVQSINLIQ